MNDDIFKSGADEHHKEVMIERDNDGKAHDSKDNVVIKEREYIDNCEKCGQPFFLCAPHISDEESDVFGSRYKVIRLDGHYLCWEHFVNVLWDNGKNNIKLKEVSMDKGLVIPEKINAIQPQEIKEVSTQTMIINMIPTSGTLKITDEQKKILFADVTDDIVEIRPDGLIYLPWMEYVSRLNKAFNCEWAIIPKDNPAIKDNHIYLGFYLIIQGKLMGYAVGEQAYYPNNPTMTYGDAIEGATSNALMRLCKRIGIGLELWKPSFIRAWKEKFAEEYYDQKKGKKLWRRKNGVVTETVESISETEKPQQEITDELINIEEVRMLKAISKPMGENFKKHLKNLYGIEEIAQIKKIWYGDILHWAKNYKV